MVAACPEGRGDATRRRASDRARRRARAAAFRSTTTSLPVALLAPTADIAGTPARAPRDRRHLHPHPRRPRARRQATAAALTGFFIVGEPRRHPRHRLRRPADREPAPSRPDAGLPDRLAAPGLHSPQLCLKGPADDRATPSSATGRDACCACRSAAAQDRGRPSTATCGRRSSRRSPRSPRRTSAGSERAWSIAHRRRLPTASAAVKAACTARTPRRQAADRLVGDAALRQRHALRRHALLPDLRARARHRQGEVDLRHPRRARGADPARPEEPRRRLLGRRQAPVTGAALPEARLHRHDGRQAARGRRRHRHSPAPTSARAASSTSTPSTPRTPSGRCRSCSRRPSSATRSSSAGPARTGPRRSTRPGSRLRARRPHRRGEVDLRDPAAGARGQDRHRQRLGLDVGRSRAAPALHPGLLAEPELLSGAVPLDLPIVTSVTALNADTGAHGLEPAARPPRHLGPRHQLRADAGRHREGRPDHPGAGPDLEAGLSLRAQPRDRRAGLSDRGAAGAGRPTCRAKPPRRPSPIVDAARARHPGPLARRLQGSPTSPERLATARETVRSLRDEGRFTPPSLQGSLVYPGTIGGIEWGGGAVDPTLAASTS